VQCDAVVNSLCLFCFMFVNCFKFLTKAINESSDGLIMQGNA